MICSRLSRSFSRSLPLLSLLLCTLVITLLLDLDTQVPLMTSPPSSTFCTSPAVSHQERLPSTWPDNITLEQVDSRWDGKLAPGGTFRPLDCLPSTRVAIIVPYREREQHLAILLEVMHPFLQRQGIQYTVLVVNQTGEAPFMRGLLFNAGVLAAASLLSPPPDCLVLHDVDHIPEVESLKYRCSHQGVFHLAQAVDRFDYNLFMPEYTGGVVAMTREQFVLVNGFSNMYLGWGCEDEDLYVRMVARGLTLVRASPKVSRYKTLPHVPNYPNWFWDQAISSLDRARFPNLQQIVDPDGSNSDRYDYNKFLQDGAGDRQDKDGLDMVEGLYTLQTVNRFHGFTSINILPDVEKIHKMGVEFILSWEEKMGRKVELEN